MRVLLSVLFVVLFWSVGNGIAQAPPPPPNPLIYAPPSAGEISKFSPTDQSFEAEFPGKPKETVQTVEGGVVTSYRVRRKGSNSVVAITTPSVDADLAPRSEDLFKSMRDGISRRPRTTVVKETDIVLNGFKGRELEVNYGLEYGLVRVYLVGSRIIEIQSDVTNWHVIGDKTKAEWRKETERFF